MIGYYLCVTVALSIFPHSTNQSEFCYVQNVIKEGLRKEKPNVLCSLVEAVNICTTPPYDLACDELTPYEKQQLCDEAMRKAVANERQMTANPNGRNIRIDSFLDNVNSNLAVPPLADPSDPYPCHKIPIEELDYKKRMFWCKNRVFTVVGSGATDQAAGFFMSGSEKQTNRVYLFKQSTTDRQKVTPWAMLTSVRILSTADVRWFLRNLMEGSSSSMVTPVSE